MTTVPPPLVQPATAKLVMHPADAMRRLREILDRGGEIKALRIRHGDELDRARGLKLEWTQDVTDMLAGMFDNTSVADFVNDWVGKIFPEYAEFGNFVEQFYEEMDHRIGRLRMVAKRIEQASETAPAPASVAPAQSTHASPAPMTPPPVATIAQPETKMSSVQRILFVAHGPKDPTSDAVLQFMQQLSLNVVEADHTNGLIDTLESAGQLGFVVVMHGAHDAGQLLSDSSMFKLGYCAGKLGLKRMCMMSPATHGSASETHGIAQLALDSGGGWQLHLARQMKRAGVDVDLNRLC